MYITRPNIFHSKSEVPKDATLFDIVASSQTELFFLEHPHLKKDAPSTKEMLEKYLQSKIPSVWAYYPWLGLAVHMPDEHTYFKLRTARNRNLITEEEQFKFREARIGIAGLSVGSAALASIVATGGPKYLKIADPDIIEITNLNRIRAKLQDVGCNKTDIAALESWELDPFLDIELWRDGITKSSLRKFMSEPRLDVFIDEMDNIQLKIQSRIVCKELRIPVVMATDNGDSVIVDVERYDTEPDWPIFHGRVDVESLDVQNMSREAFVKMANEIIDPTLFTERQQLSLMEIGHTLSGVPQLGSAATIAGATVAYVARQIVCGADIPSGRYVMGCEQTFIPDYNSAPAKKRRAVHTKKFKAHFGHA